MADAVTSRSALRPLLAVCVLFAVASSVAVPATLGLGWDEVVYVSQYGTHAPAAFMSAPRSRGVTLLVGPVASWFDSTVALRLFLTATATIALGLAFWVWSRVLRQPRIAALAAGMYASLWIALFYANAAMPNHYTAMAAVTAVGCFLLAAAEPARPGAYLGLVAALLVAALMRPADAFWLGLPLLGGILAVPALRRRRLAVAVIAGLALGVAPWVVEAETRYGGLAERIRQAGQVQGGTELGFSLPKVISTLDGPILCRPCDSPLYWPAALWWVALALLVPLGVRAARRAGTSPTAWLPVAVAASTAFPYLFLIGYSAPRFLLPAYGLALIPAAAGLAALLSATSGTWRRVLTAVVAAGCAGHLAIQAGILLHVVSEQIRGRGDWARIAETLRSHGVRPPCVVTGHEAIPVAYYTRCRALEDRGYNRNVSTAQLREAAASTSVAVLVKDDSPPDWARDWRRVPVRGLSTSGWALYLPTRASGAPN
ncbi:hypothetical protein GA0070624_4128 [Micromonospora rhizosphaerae]|uniref:4-amino-4-deoxy-L-arabinose transferase n=1 Tax=Micromonospora rhizosphaerae TaxID=568872 RepID=A0A1C6SMS3_9ACTN|nr:hypothetical protein [Micromonospora rhizosphaerae]SCL30707.1 hypothetical protein GA0070624_4128 [Micromonospora rhizosphaerae]